MARETKPDGWDKLAPLIASAGAFFFFIWMGVFSAFGRLARFVRGKKRRE